MYQIRIDMVSLWGSQIIPFQAVLYGTVGIVYPAIFFLN